MTMMTTMPLLTAARAQNAALTAKLRCGGATRHFLTSFKFSSANRNRKSAGSANWPENQVLGGKLT
jgi:hypothetical protein